MKGGHYQYVLPRLQAWVLALAFIVLLPISAAAQNAGVPFEHGNHAFRYVLYSHELEPLKDKTSLDANSILILFGETQFLDQIPGGLDKFLNNGGAVLVATDRSLQEKWQKFFHIELKHEFINAPADLAYRRIPECPWVVPAHVDGIPIFRNLSQVATNKPAYLLNHSKELKTLATFSGDCWVDNGRNHIRLSDRHPEPAVFAVGGAHGAGKILILSDHSVFINEMMIQQDNDNFDFADHCIRWLMDRGQNQEERKQVLFLDEGETIENFNVPLTLTDVPRPPIDVLNQFLVKLEQENFFNRLILQGNPGQRLGDIIRWLTIVITTAVTGFGCYRFLQARHRTESGEPLFSAKMAQQSPDLALVTRRHLDMVKANNFWEAAHHLARDWFHTVVPGLFESAAESGGARPRLPRVTIDAGWWRRWSWEGKVKGVWRLAAGSPRKLTAAEFARFVTQLDEIKTAQKRGLLQIQNIH